MMDNQLPHNTEEIVVGLDIETTKIACFIGQKNEFSVVARSGAAGVLVLGFLSTLRDAQGG